LPITRQIVEAHGGSIEFSDRAPHGTRVMLLLPRAASAERGKTPDAPRAQPSAVEG
jgi:signal transduction histidine kinase